MFSFLSLFITSGLAAEPQPKHHKPVVIVATKRFSPPLLSPAVERITAAQIAALQYSYLNDVLQQEPGMNVVQSGSIGQQSSVFIRGMNANHVVVRIDGMRVNEPASPTGSFDFADLSTAGLESVDVIRGAASSLYGADAVGGVINLSSQKGAGAVKANTRAEIGSAFSERVEGGISGKVRGTHMMLTAGIFHTAGSTVTPDYLQAAGGDYPRLPYTLKNFAFRGGRKFFDQTEVTLFSRLNEAILSYQKDLGSLSQRRRQILNRLQVDHTVKDSWTHQIGIGILSTAYTNAKDQPDFSQSQGQRIAFDWRQNIYMHSQYQLEPVLEIEQEQFQAHFRSIPSKARQQKGGLALLQRWMPMTVLTIEFTMRQDWSNQFSSPLCYRGGVKWRIPKTETELFTSYGTAFKAPTLFQLFGRSAGFIGNPDLKPEQVKSYEIGVRHPLTSFLQATVIYFHNDLSQLIDYDFASQRERNITKATTKGIESILTFLPWQHVKLELNHTLLLAREEKTGQVLKRRPKHKVFIRAGYETETSHLFAEWMWVGKRLDVHPKTFQAVDNKPYHKLTLKADYRFNHDWVLYARVENVLNKEIEDPLGYLQARVVGYVGVRAQF